MIFFFWPFAEKPQYMHHSLYAFVVHFVTAIPELSANSSDSIFTFMVIKDISYLFFQSLVSFSRASPRIPPELTACSGVVFY